MNIYKYSSVIGINIQCNQKNCSKVNDYNIKTNWYKKVEQKTYTKISRINEGSPTTIGRVYSVHLSQGEIRFRLTIRVILQLILQRSDGDCARNSKRVV